MLSSAKFNIIVALKSIPAERVDARTWKYALVSAGK